MSGINSPSADDDINLFTSRIIAKIMKEDNGIVSGGLGDSQGFIPADDTPLPITITKQCKEKLRTAFESLN